VRRQPGQRARGPLRGATRASAMRATWSPAAGSESPKPSGC
jgi:hypothetical protein